MQASLHKAAPMTKHALQNGALRLAFLSAVVSLIVSFAAAAAPIPLYNIYRAEDGFTNAGVSMAVVIYSVGTIAALLLLGRLSDYVGRRPAAIASRSSYIVAILACRAAASSPSARKQRRRRRVFGDRSSPASAYQPGSGLCCQSLQRCSWLLGRPGPSTRRSCLRWSSDQLHTGSPLVLGLVFAAYMPPSVLGAPIGGRFTSAVAQRIGMIIFLTGMISSLRPAHS
jgi:hypothetical protein